MFNFYKKLLNMAKKKKSTRRRRRGLSGGALMARPHRRRRSRKRGLSEAFSPATATASAKNMLMGAVGGTGYALIKPAVESATDNKIVKHGILLGASFLTSAVLKMDGISAGIAGAWAADTSKEVLGLADMNDTDFADDDVLDEPEYLDEMGNPMYLAEDGQFYYMDEMNEDDMMDEDDLSAAPVYLADGGFYPEYVNTSNY